MQLWALFVLTFQQKLTFWGKKLHTTGNNSSVLRYLMTSLSVILWKYLFAAVVSHILSTAVCVCTERMSSVSTVAAKFNRLPLNSTQVLFVFPPRHQSWFWLKKKIKEVKRVRSVCEDEEIYSRWCVLLRLSLMLLSRSHVWWKGDLNSRWGYLQLA